MVVPDMYFLVADVMMDGLNMRRADGTATIAFETPGAMQDSEARGPAVSQGGEKARARPKPRLTASSEKLTRKYFPEILRAGAHVMVRGSV